MFESKIKAIAENNRKIGAMETILYVKTAINMGHDAEDIWHLLTIYGDELGSTDAIDEDSDSN